MSANMSPDMSGAVPVQIRTAAPVAATARYQLRQLLHIAGLTELCDSVPPLKGAKKLKALHDIWRRVCLDNRWTFSPR